MTPALDARAVFAALADAGVEYVVIGGWAVNAHGYVRATRDVDICPDPAHGNLERLAGLLRELNGRQLGLDGFDARELPGDPLDPRSLAEGGNFRIETDLGVIDVMQWVDSSEGELKYADRRAPGVRAPNSSRTAASLSSLSGR